MKEGYQPNNEHLDSINSKIIERINWYKEGFDHVLFQINNISKETDPEAFINILITEMEYLKGDILAFLYQLKKENIEVENGLVNDFFLIEQKINNIDSLLLTEIRDRIQEISQKFERAIKQKDFDINEMRRDLLMPILRIIHELKNEDGKNPGNPVASFLLKEATVLENKISKYETLANIDDDTIIPEYSTGFYVRIENTKDGWKNISTPTTPLGEENGVEHFHDAEAIVLNIGEENKTPALEINSIGEDITKARTDYILKNMQARKEQKKEAKEKGFFVRGKRFVSETIQKCNDGVSNLKEKIQEKVNDIHYHFNPFVNYSAEDLIKKTKSEAKNSYEEAMQKIIMQACKDGIILSKEIDRTKTGFEAYRMVAKSYLERIKNTRDPSLIVEKFESRMVIYAVFKEIIERYLENISTSSMDKKEEYKKTLTKIFEQEKESQDKISVLAREFILLINTYPKGNNSKNNVVNFPNKNRHKRAA